jgi:hypothetical protein
MRPFLFKKGEKLLAMRMQSRMSNLHNITNGSISEAGQSIFSVLDRSAMLTYLNPATDLLRKLTEDRWRDRIGLQEAREHAWLQGCSLPSLVVEAPLYEDPLVQELFDADGARRPMMEIAATYTPHAGKSATTEPLSTQELRMAGYGRNATFMLNPPVPPITNQVVGQNNDGGLAPAHPPSQAATATSSAPALHPASVLALAPAPAVPPAGPSNAEMLNTAEATTSNMSSGALAAVTAASPSRTASFTSTSEAEVSALLLPDDQGTGPSSHHHAGQVADDASLPSVLPETSLEVQTRIPARMDHSRAKRGVLQPATMELDTIMEAPDPEILNADAGPSSQAAPVLRRSNRIKAKATQTEDESTSSKRKGGPHCAAGTNKKCKKCKT